MEGAQAQAYREAEALVGAGTMLVTATNQSSEQFEQSSPHDSIETQYSQQHDNCNHEILWRLFHVVDMNARNFEWSASQRGL